MLFLYSYFVGYLSELILRTRIPIILFCLPGIWGWRACCASGRRAASTTAWFVGRAGAWGERGGGAGRIIVLDDPGCAFAVRWVLALLGWADANGAVWEGVSRASSVASPGGFRDARLWTWWRGKSTEREDERGAMLARCRPALASREAL